jgi:coenzyme F420-0:L-glutamate ligase/coenzyme F420-1:gamma-L-glutamate ligase
VTVPAELRVFAVEGIPEVREGDDLGALIAGAMRAQGTPPETGDVLVVTQKVVSKAEGRVIDLAAVEPSAFARQIAEAWEKDPRQVEVVLRESRRIVRMDRGVLICETRHGLVCANAGVDASNAAAGTVVLLPEDPDASARAIRERVRSLTGADVAVIVSDTFGRPWRNGLVNFAIGVAGMAPLKDYSGQTDPAGYELRVTQMCWPDELAAAAELVMGKLDRVPAAVVRGLRWRPGAGSARELVREPEKDLFR